MRMGMFLHALKKDVGSINSINLGKNMTQNWYWHNDHEKEKTVIQHVDAIAVYVNNDNNIVIRQEDPMGSNEDKWIVVPRAQVETLIAAMRREMDEPPIPLGEPDQESLID